MTPHPLEDAYTTEETLLLMEQPGGLERYLEERAARERRIRLSQWSENDWFSSDPHRYGYELPHWADSDVLIGFTPRTQATLDALPAKWDRPYTRRWPEEMRARLGRLPAHLLEREFYILVLLGGNRSGKSEYCARRVVQSALAHAGSTIVCLSEDLDASRENQQTLIWKYLPLEIKAVNGKKDPHFHVNYSKKGGFTLEKVILPNGSSIHFRSYNQEPGSIEGWMLGCRQGRAVGAWADESLSTGWLKVLERRCKYCGAVCLWSFTPVSGMTPAIKEAVGEGPTDMSLPSELLPDRVNVEGVPAGEMPYIRVGRMNGVIVQYYFTLLNPFGTATGSFYDSVKSLCQGRPSAYTMRIAYGFTLDTLGRKFPGFTSQHVLRVADIPEVGSLVQFTDPHSSRHYATIWVLVTPSDPPDYIVVRDWPDEASYGEWAVPTMREMSGDGRRGADGDEGPAQQGSGMGVIDYKRLWRELETVAVPAALQQDKALTPEQLESELRKMKYPFHRGRLRWLYHRSKKLPATVPEQEEWQNQRTMDARFCNTQYAISTGSTCLKWLFEQPDVDAATGEVIMPGFPILESSGKDLEHGEALISDLLSYDRSRPLVPGINAPRLYVSEECTQVRWALENFTGRAGSTGACKEWIDLLRHLAESKPCYLPPHGLKSTGGGSY